MRIPFDQFQRYKQAVEIINNFRLKNENLSILEVGANEHKNLERFLIEDDITYLDINIPAHLKDDLSYIEGDATAMTFNDKEFDIVIALDVFEHIDSNKREAFVSELYRVSNRAFIIAAPFNELEVVRAEVRANEYFRVLYGEGYRWLEEHIDNQLPDMSETLELLKKLNIKFKTYKHGSLYFWEKLMKLHFLVAGDSELLNLRLDMDEFYNKHIYENDYHKPCYRSFIIGAKDTNNLKKIEMTTDKSAVINTDSLLKFYELESKIYYEASIIKNKKEKPSMPHQIQLFWEDYKGNYTEDCSIKIPYEVNDTYNTHCLSIPSSAKGKLRLDLVNHPAKVDISRIVMIENDKQYNEITHEWNSSNFSELLLGKEVISLPNSNDICLMCLHSDMQLYLPSLTINTENNNRKICVTMKVNHDISDIIDTIVSETVEVIEKNDKLKDVILERNEKLDQTEDKKRQLLEVIQEKDNELNKLADKAVKLREVIQEKEEELFAWSEKALEFKKKKINLESKLQQMENSLMKLNTNYKNKETIILKLETEKNDLKNDNYILANKNNDNEEKFREYQMQLNNKNKEIAEVLNSQSWRYTAPLRYLGDKVKRSLETCEKIYQVLSRKKYYPQLVPVKDLVIKGDNLWESTNNDPQFIIEGYTPTGWVFVNWQGNAETPILLTLYCDLGNGFREQDVIPLNVMDKKEDDLHNAIIYIPENIKRIRLDTGDIPTTFEFSRLSFQKISRMSVFIRALNNFASMKGMKINSVVSLISRAWDIIKAEGIKALWKKVTKHANGSSPDSASANICYQTWIKRNSLSDTEIEDIDKDIKKMKYKPLISIILPVYNVDEKWLRKCIESVTNQFYTNWELCIADDASPKPHIRKVLAEYMEKDKRIKVVFRQENGHISEASNSAMELALGEFVGLLDHDDEITPDALYENVKILNKFPDADMIYSDEDKITEDGQRHSPFFKPSWSPDTILSMMYTCHFGVYRTSIVKQIGGFRKGYEGSQDHDLVLRFTEKTNRIHHIPKILYHWRTIAESTAMNAGTKNYAHKAGLRAVEDAIKRRRENAVVSSVGNYAGRYHVYYKLPEVKPLISIIIPTKDKVDLLSVCIESIFTISTYENYEIIVVDNGSTEQETIDFFKNWKEKEPNRFKVLHLNIPFNYSKLNNEAVKIAKGELILLLNNDIKVITPDWLEHMAGQAMRSKIGAVGAKLLYDDDTIQHAGVILGIGGVAGHCFKGFDKNNTGYFDRILIISNFSAVTAACLMVRKDIFVKINGLDELLEIAFNDIDFCSRIYKKGYYNVLLPDVLLYHYESKSRGYENTSEKIKRFNSEIDFMINRWGKALVNDPFYNPNLTLDREDFSIKL